MENRKKENHAKQTQGLPLLRTGGLILASIPLPSGCSMRPVKNRGKVCFVKDLCKIAIARSAVFDVLQLCCRASMA